MQAFRIETRPALGAALWVAYITVSENDIADTDCSRLAAMPLLSGARPPMRLSALEPVVFYLETESWAGGLGDRSSQGRRGDYPGGRRHGQERAQVEVKRKKEGC